MKIHRNLKSTLLIFVSLGFATTVALAHEGEAHVKSGASAVPRSYPLKKCVVSDEDLGEHGNPVKVSYKGTDVWLCCKKCIKEFDKDPEKFVKIVKDAKSKK